MRSLWLKTVLVFCLSLVWASVCGAAEAELPDSLDTARLQKILDGPGKGKVVMVNIFASWCPPCRAEIPGLISVRGSVPESDLLILGVSVDNEEPALREFMKRYKFNYPLYIATEDFVNAFSVSAIPHMLIYNQKGELADNHIGFMSEKDIKAKLKELSAAK